MAAVILSAIEKLDSWLLQKADHRNDREMLYGLLVEVADPWGVKDVKGVVGEMEDLWELNCREKLHTLLLEMLDPNIDDEKLFSLAVEMADLWKDSKGKLNKEKLYSWLRWRISGKTAKKKLIRLREGMTSLEGPNEEDWEYVEGVRNDLRFILNELEDEGSSDGHLHYFISDVVEMAQDVQLLFHLKDSDPFILFLQIIKNIQAASFLKFFDEIKLIHQRLQKTKKRVRKFGGDETSQINNVREELVSPSPTYSESDHHAVGLKEDMELLLRNSRTTIRIRGLAGSGKTTLAREFYNHPKIVDGFECRAWVCLSSWKLSRKEILIKLIRQFIHSKRDDMLIEKMENKALQLMLRHMS